MEAQTLIKFVSEQGFLIVFAAMIMYFGYQYLKLKLDQTKKEFEEKLKDKQYQLSGNISIMEDDNMNKIFVDLKVKELDEKQ